MKPRHPPVVVRANTSVRPQRGVVRRHQTRRNEVFRRVSEAWEYAVRGRRGSGARRGTSGEDHGTDQPIAVLRRGRGRRGLRGAHGLAVAAVRGARAAGGAGAARLDRGDPAGDRGRARPRGERELPVLRLLGRAAGHNDKAPAVRRARAAGSTPRSATIKGGLVQPSPAAGAGPGDTGCPRGPVDRRARSSPYGSSAAGRGPSTRATSICRRSTSSSSPPASGSPSSSRSAATPAGSCPLRSISGCRRTRAS